MICNTSLCPLQSKLNEMLEALGMKFEGNEHSGIDDSRNIARILMRMLQDGAKMKVNEKIHARKLQRCGSGLGHNMPTATLSCDDDDVMVEACDDDCDDDDGDDGCLQECVQTSIDALRDDVTRLSVRNDVSGSAAAASDSCDSTQCDDLLLYYSLQNRTASKR